MRYNRYIVFISTLLIFQLSETIAQKYLNEGNRYYDRNLFEEAIPHYLKELEKGKSYTAKNEARERLASCYRLTGNFLEANEIYKKIVYTSNRNNKSENVLNYANSLKSSALYEEAAEQFQNYITLEPDDPMGPIYVKSCNMAQDWLNEEDEYFVQNLEMINTSESDFAPAYYNNGIVITSSREGGMRKFINLSDISNETATDLYYINLRNSNPQQPDITNMELLNSYLHDGSATFSKDGNEVYFTRTVMGKKDRKKNVILNSLQVFYSRKDPAGNWSEPVSAFSFNSNKYSIGQPSLSADGRTIYYISDMPGGHGETDVYYSEKQRDNNWGPPVNAGRSVNTFGHELAPFIHGNDTLFFSSDTHPGMGKLDIFYSVKKEGEWGEVFNMKPPVNSIGDDFSIVLSPCGNKGFFSSDRFNGYGKEDIYTLYREEPLTLEFNGPELRFPDHTLYNGLSFRISSEGVPETYTPEVKNGMFTHTLETDSLYRISIRKSGFSYDAISLKISRETENDSVFTAELQSRITPMVVHGTLTSPKQTIIKKTFPGDQKQKEPVEQSDTIIEYIPIPSAKILLSEENNTISQTVTNDQGNYELPEILENGKQYLLTAIKTEPEKALIVEEEPAESELETQVAEEPVVEEEPAESEPETQVAEEPVVEEEMKEDIPAENELAQAEDEGEAVKDHDDEGTKVDKGAAANREAAELENEDYMQIAGTVVSEKDKKKIPDVQIKVYSDDKLESEGATDTVGKFDLTVPVRELYDVDMNKKGYFHKQVKLTKGEAKNPETLQNIPMPPIVKHKSIGIPNIFFDLDKSDVKPESHRELNRLADFMKANPDVTIELNAHTDTRGSFYYNIKLSYQRAESVRAYLNEQGISDHRIIAQGFGESFPVVPNAITESDHSVNRRAEFSVTDTIGNDQWYISADEPLKTTGFMILHENVYSEKRPFTGNAPLPRGLFYRVKIAEFSKPVNYNAFKGLFPIVQQTNRDRNTYSYYAGLFTSLEDAEEGLEIIRRNFIDAEIEAYHNNRMISLNQSRVVKETSDEGDGTIYPGDGLVYTVQVGAYRREIWPSAVKKMRELAPRYELISIRDKSNIIYAIGSFSSYEEAFNTKASFAAEGHFSDAFVIAILDGRKIPIQEAKRMSGEE